MSLDERDIEERAFQKEFPSLKDVKWHFNPYGDEKAFSEYDIEKYCLDKQKVLDALLFWFSNMRTTVKTNNERLDKVFKELKLKKDIFGMEVKIDTSLRKDEVEL